MPPRKVLIVDDEPGIRDLLADVLAGEGYAVATAQHGVEALDQLAQDGVSVILLDMRMPVMNGWQFAAAYRKRPGRHAPLLVMTAAQHAQRWCREVDAEGCVPKPFDVTALVAIVHRLAEPPEAA